MYMAKELMIKNNISIAMVSRATGISICRLLAMYDDKKKATLRETVAIASYFRLSNQEYAEMFLL